MTSETIDLDPAALRSAGTAFKEKADSIDALAGRFDALLGEITEASKVEGVEMIAIAKMVASFNDVVKTVKEDLMTQASNARTLGNAFINQANGTQDADLDTTKNVNSAAGDQA